MPKTGNNISKMKERDQLRLLYSYMHVLDGGFYDYIKQKYNV